MIGPIVCAVLLLGTLGSALLLADRVGARHLRARPHAISRLPLIAIALVAGLGLVAGLPATWPIVIGFALVCALLAAVILLGALAGTPLNIRCRAPGIRRRRYPPARCGSRSGRRPGTRTS